MSFNDTIALVGGLFITILILYTAIRIIKQDYQPHNK